MPSPLNANKWMRVFLTTDEEGLCKAFGKYMFELWFQMERDIGIEPKKCPIKKVSIDLFHSRLKPNSRPCVEKL